MASMRLQSDSCPVKERLRGQPSQDGYDKSEANKGQLERSDSQHQPVCSTTLLPCDGICCLLCMPACNLLPAGREETSSVVRDEPSPEDAGLSNSFSLRG
eukprot:760968-Hanusia_phi.AAC.2